MAIIAVKFEVEVERAATAVWEAAVTPAEIIVGGLVPVKLVYRPVITFPEPSWPAVLFAVPPASIAGSAPAVELVVAVRLGWVESFILLRAVSTGSLLVVYEAFEVPS